MVLQVIFWLLLLLCAIGAAVPDAPPPNYVGRGRWVIALILIAIIGLKVFDNPLTK